MAWTSPMTAVSGDVFTATQYNTNIRDNLLETAPAIAETVGSHFVGVQANSINERLAATATVATSQTTTSTTYTDLSTVGPQVTADTGIKAWVAFGCTGGNSVATSDSLTSIDVSGDTTIAANDDRAAGRQIGDQAGYRWRFTRVILITGLTVGSNTFTMKYRVDADTGTFLDRRLCVIPF